MPRSLKLLHVEDDRTQRVLIAHHLGTIREFAFTVAAAESEDEALRKKAIWYQGAIRAAFDYFARKHGHSAD